MQFHNFIIARIKYKLNSKKPRKIEPMKNKKNLPSEIILANIYLFKVNSINTKKRSEICSKVTIKTPELTSLPQF